MSNEQTGCAHLNVLYEKGICDGPNIRGEVVPNIANYDIWKCRDCGTRFLPRPAESVSPAPPSTNFLQRLGGMCFAHGEYGPEGCSKWPTCATDPQIYGPVAAPQEGVDELMEKIGNVPPQIGLAQQGHMGTVHSMILDGKSWDEIGTAIGWTGKATMEWYAIEAAREIEKLQSDYAAKCAELQKAESELAERLAAREQYRKVCLCFWCGELFALRRDGTREEKADDLTAHAMLCTNNPWHGADARAIAAESRLAEVGKALELAMKALSVEQRIAVKAELARAGVKR